MLQGLQIDVGDILLFLSGVLAAIITFVTTKQRDKQTADAELREDLMKLYNEQQTNINELNKEIINLREKNARIIEQNAELRDSLSAEREQVTVHRAENERLRGMIDELQQDKARLANRIIAMEDEVRRLRNLVESRTDNDSNRDRPNFTSTEW